MKFLADLLSMIGVSFANVGTQGCAIWFVDEPEMPRCLLDR